MAGLSWSFRIFLLLGSVTVFLIISRCIRKKWIQMKDGIFWIAFGFLLVVISGFPKLTAWASQLLGIQSPTNCVFFLIIFLLGCHQFTLTIRLSQLDMKNSKLTQNIAIQRTLEDEEKNQ